MPCSHRSRSDLPSCRELQHPPITLSVAANPDMSLQSTVGYPDVILRIGRHSDGRLDLPVVRQRLSPGLDRSERSGNKAALAKNGGSDRISTAIGISTLALTFFLRDASWTQSMTRGTPGTLDFSRMSPGDVLAVCPTDVSRPGKGDHQPGVPPETRRIAGGAIVLIMPIRADHMTAASAQLVLRCEPDGQILAAINRAPSA